MKDRTLPTVDRACPKCSNGTAHGPEYRRGFDDTLGEHLRFYCTVCRYMTVEPTRDQDTPERRVELRQAMQDRTFRHAPAQDPEVGNSDIERTRQRDMGRRGYGWK